jgi:hypothetical protein
VSYSITALIQALSIYTEIITSCYTSKKSKLFNSSLIINKDLLHPLGVVSFFSVCYLIAGLILVNQIADNLSPIPTCDLLPNDLIPRFTSRQVSRQQQQQASLTHNSAFFETFLLPKAGFSRRATTHSPYPILLFATTSPWQLHRICSCTRFRCTLRRPFLKRSWASSLGPRSSKSSRCRAPF